MDSGLYTVAVPIGNLEDITLRALKVLRDVDIIASEDTRRIKILLKKHGIEGKKLVSHHKFNEKRALNRIIDFIKGGKSVALVSDSGTPCISDPGAFLLEECIKKGIRIIPIPGPSALCAALSASGIVGKFVFIGFLGKKRKDILELKKIRDEQGYSIVFFESPYRIIRTLNRLKEENIKGKIVLWREMTKIYEECICGEIDEVLKYLTEKGKNKGEFVVILK